MGPSRIRLLFASAASTLLLAACDHDSAAPPAPSRPEPSAQPARPAESAPPALSALPDTHAAEDASADAVDFVPPGSPVIPLRPVELAVYVPAPTSPALLKDTEQKLHARFPTSKVLTKPEAVPPPAVVVFAPEAGDFALPSAAELATYGRGLRPQQVETAAASKGALLLGWMLDADPKLLELRKAQDLVLDVAQKTSGFVWDDASHELFSPQSWKALRVDGWQGDVPDLRRQYTTRYYKTADGRGRVVTLGLAKLGLPDLTAEDVPVMQSAALVTLMGAVGQLLVEGAVVGEGGRLTVDVKAIRHGAARAAIVAAAAPNAPLHGNVTLAVVDPEEGDPENRLAELRFDEYGGPRASSAEREAAAIQAILGATPPEMTGPDDPELKAIAQRAQAKLPSLMAAVQKGLPKGSELRVRIPFAVEGDAFEWRWMTVEEWKGHRLRGDLVSDKNAPSELGAPVDADQSWVTDYVLQKPDGQEGGESLKLLAARAAGKK
jgi:hypothetical protein